MLLEALSNIVCLYLMARSLLVKDFFKQVLKCWCYYMRDCVIHKLLISFCCLFLIAKIYSRKDKRILPDVNFIFQFPKRPFVIHCSKRRVLLLCQLSNWIFSLAGRSVWVFLFFLKFLVCWLYVSNVSLTTILIDEMNCFIFGYSFFPIFWEAVFVFIWAMGRQTMLGNQSRNLQNDMQKNRIS